MKDRQANKVYSQEARSGAKDQKNYVIKKPRETTVK